MNALGEAEPLDLSFELFEATRGALYLGLAQAEGHHAVSSLGE